MSTAVIVAGGEGRRLGGADKTQLLVGGRRLIDRQVAVLRDVADDVLLISHDDRVPGPPGLRVECDLVPQRGALAGLYTALVLAPTSPILVVACDMPFLSAPFLAHLLDTIQTRDASVPRTAAGLQPLCASYARRCAPLIRRRLDAGQMRVTQLLSEMEVCEIGPEEIAPYDPHGLLFFNINTPGDYERAQEHARRLERLSLPQPSS